MKQQCQDTVKRDKHQAGKYKQTLTNCYVLHSKGRLEHCVLLEKICFQKTCKAINGSSDDKNGKKLTCGIRNLKRLSKLGYPSLKKRMLKRKMTVFMK